MFLPNFFRPKIKNILGIDVGHASTKIVKLSPDAGKQTVEFCGIFPEPSTDGNFAQKLRDYLTRNKLTGLTAAACLDDPSTRIRKFELPKMPEGDLRDAVRWKMREIVEGSIEEYNVRHSTIAGLPGAKKLTLIGYAVKNAPVLSLAKTLHQAGLNPEYIEPTSVSLAFCMETVQAGKQEWIAGIDLGAAKSLMVITSQESFYFSRPLVGIRVVPEMTADPSFKQKLAAEIQNSLDTFAVTFQQEALLKIYLSGGGAEIGGVSEHLSTNLGIKTEVLNPFSGIEIAEPFRQIAMEKPFLFSQAFALAKMGQT